jgi:hypothetical protein
VCVRKNEGETALTNTKIIKQNIKAPEAQNHNNYTRTTPSHLSSLFEHFFPSLMIGVQEKACGVQRTKLKSRFFLKYFSFNTSETSE